MTASDLYALSQGTRNEGDQRCHWCGSACRRHWIHDDPPPIPHVRSTSTALCPACPYVCSGCWLWRRASVTARFLANLPDRKPYRDRQTARNLSWWITDKGAWAIEADDRPTLWELLLQPPPRFALMLLDCRGCDNRLQLGIANDHAGPVRGDTEFAFTVNNIPHRYTTYGLESALRDGEGTGEPGALALIALLGRHQLPPAVEEPIKRGKGRPREEQAKERSPKKMVFCSGSRQE